MPHLVVEVVSLESQIETESSVVHEHLDRSLRVGESRLDGGQLRRIREVGGQDLAGHPEVRLEVVRHPRQRARVASHQHQVGAARGELSSELGSKSGARPGDQCSLGHARELMRGVRSGGTDSGCRCSTCASRSLGLDAPCASRCGPARWCRRRPRHPARSPPAGSRRRGPRGRAVRRRRSRSNPDRPLMPARVRLRASRRARRRHPSSSSWRVTTMLRRPGSGRNRGGNDSHVRRPITTGAPRVVLLKCAQVFGDMPGHAAVGTNDPAARFGPDHPDGEVIPDIGEVGHTAYGTPGWRDGAGSPPRRSLRTCSRRSNPASVRCAASAARTAHARAASCTCSRWLS